MNDQPPRGSTGRIASLAIIVMLAVMLIAMSSRVSAQTAVPTAAPTQNGTPAATQQAGATAEATALPTEAATGAAGADCKLEATLKSVKGLLKYDQFDVGAASILTFHSLNIWFVDPALDPKAASKSDLDKNAKLAEHDGALLSQQVVAGNNCVAPLFSVINPIVVDSTYNGWFSGTLNTASMSTTATLSDTDLQQLERGFTIAFLRDKPTTKFSAAPKKSCTWADVRKAMYSQQFSPDEQLNSFGFVIDPTGVNVYAEFAIPQSMMGTSQMQASYIISGILDALIPLTCLYPVPTKITIQAVDPNANYVLIGTLPGSAIGLQDPKQVISKLTIVYPKQ